MDVSQLPELVAVLRAEGSDLAEVEVKHAAGGFPRSVATTVSAFANTPGGGLLLFGLDEKAGFAASGVYDVTACKAALASLARQALDPPVTFVAETVAFEGTSLVAAEVHEAPSVAKPVRVRANGRAYLRANDGDYELSQVEEQAFLANRETPRFDQAAVEGASVGGDLDPALVEAYLDSCRRSSASLVRLSDADILFRTGVTTGPERTPTLAGLLALAIHPQQFVPNAVIQASVAPQPGDPPGTRARDAKRFDGPVPLMLDEALRWVARNTRTRVRFGADGHGHDEPEYPPEAVRELLSNALVHRDLGPHALTQAITLKLDPNQLLISNPGGLWGLTVSSLGTVGVSSTRNSYLARICQNVRSGRDRRVIEALASGVPTILASLSAAGMVPPRFHDQGIRFTVRVPNDVLLAPDDLAWLNGITPAGGLSDVQRHALAAMRHGTVWSNKSLREAYPMDSREATAVLTGLVTAGLAEPVGEGGARAYQLASHGTRPSPDTATRSPRRYTSRRDNARKILDHLTREGPATLVELGAACGLSNRQTQYALDLLREQGDVELLGGRGTTSRYRAGPRN
ncbi:ATP-binding protein [Streptomyces sp. 6N223]|uniref:ATP-binding protein n=1 Tax=Streptomyces sp. 6N223 TaxID=3457412 RepID=UPI003FD549C3